MLFSFQKSKFFAKPKTDLFHASAKGATSRKIKKGGGEDAPRPFSIAV